MVNFTDAVKSGLPTAIFEDPMVALESMPGTGEPKQAGGPMAMFGGGGPQPKGDILPLWRTLGLDIPRQPGPMGLQSPDLCWHEYNPYPVLAETSEATDLWVFAREEAPGADGAFSSESEISKGLSQSPVVTSPTTGSQYPATVPDYYKMQKAAPEISAKLSDLYNNKGGSNAVRAWLQSPEAAQYMNNPAFREAAESYMGKVPGMMAQAGKVAGTVARGAGRVLGPVGMGMNLYDAGQMARQTQLGERLGQGQAQMAEQAFRSGLGMNYQGPQLQPQEAQNVLQSGSPRDIKYFGGEDRLREMIRKKAAEKVLGPVAPGSF
jgi:hypothetical protein